VTGRTGPDHREVGIAAQRGSALDVAKVVDELDRRIGVDRVDHLGEAGDLRIAVRDAAPSPTAQ
jgi:hypothetical protein